MLHSDSTNMNLWMAENIPDYYEKILDTSRKINDKLYNLVEMCEELIFSDNKNKTLLNKDKESNSSNRYFITLTPPF